MAAQLRRAVEHDAGALRGVAILVRVGRDRGDAGQREIEGRHRPAERARKRQHEAAETGVGVEADVARAGELGELGDRVDDAVREAGRRADHADRVATDRAAHRGHVGAEVRADRHAHQLDAEALCRLVERDVGRGRRDDLRVADAALGLRPVAIGLHRQHDALGAAGADHAADPTGPATIVADLGCAEHLRGHRDDLGLELHHRGPEIGVQRVGLRVAGVDLREERDVLVVTVVDGAGDEAVAPAIALAGREHAELGEHLVARAAVLGQRGGAGELVAVGLRGAADLAEQLVVLAGDAIAHERQALGLLEQTVERARAGARETATDPRGWSCHARRETSDVPVEPARVARIRATGGPPAGQLAGRVRASPRDHVARIRARAMHSGAAMADPRHRSFPSCEWLMFPIAVPGCIASPLRAAARRPAHRRGRHRRHRRVPAPGQCAELARQVLRRFDRGCVVGADRGALRRRRPACARGRSRRDAIERPPRRRADAQRRAHRPAPGVRSVRHAAARRRRPPAARASRSRSTTRPRPSSWSGPTRSTRG